MDARFLGRKCKVNVRLDGNDLFYTAVVNSFSSTHVSITDKFGKDFLFSWGLVVMIELLDDGENEKMEVCEDGFDK